MEVLYSLPQILLHAFFLYMILECWGIPAGLLFLFSLYLMPGILCRLALFILGLLIVIILSFFIIFVGLLLLSIIIGTAIPFMVNAITDLQKFFVFSFIFICNVPTEFSKIISSGIAEKFSENVPLIQRLGEPIFYCPICTEPIIVMKAPTCGRIFCSDSIDRLEEEQETCPACRQPNERSIRIFLPPTH